jgi:hypothetical protein
VGAEPDGLRIDRVRGFVCPDPDGLCLDRVRGFVFDIDGTLVHRGADGRAIPQPGAVEVLERIRASDRPLVLFTNASQICSETIARLLREDGLPVADDELLTPVDRPPPICAAAIRTAPGCCSPPK